MSAWGPWTDAALRTDDGSRELLEAIGAHHVPAGDGDRSEALRWDDHGALRLAWDDAPLRCYVARKAPPLLVVQAVVVEDLEESNRLVDLLNEVNAGVVTARIYWDLGWVVAQAEVLAATVAPADVYHLLWSVGSLASWVRDEIVEDLGGVLYVDPQAPRVDPTHEVA